MKAVLAALLLSLSGCSVNSPPCRETRLLLGTYVTIMAADHDKPLREQRAAVRAAFHEIERLEAILSSFRGDSMVAKINSAGTKDIPLDDDTFYVVERALYFYRVSGGAFDITVLPLMELWGFRANAKRAMPDKASISAVLERTGSDKIVLDSQKKTIRFLTAGMKVDLGGIATGYAVDRAVDALKTRGIKNGLVDAGGDIRCFGKRSPARQWSIGIRDPLNRGRIIERVLPSDAAITTSGGYEKFVEINGKRFIHIINPKTGCPVENNVLSATIIAEDCLTADALATAAVVMGKDKTLKMIEGLNGVQAVVITKEKS
jgi:thiamine biosynthesis lipoprotein